MTKGRLALVLALACAAGEATAAGDATAAAAPRIEALVSPVTVRLRGLSAVSDAVAWASGREGTVVHTTDGGRTWQVSRVPGAGALDFRDVQAFGPDEAIVMGAGPGDASRVYRTTDGGATWALVLRNTDAAGFFDCMDFDGNEGRLLGDPVGGRFQLYASRDRGATWATALGPRAAEGEAAFAASGTCVKRIGGATIVVTGGTRARVHVLRDRFARKADWHALDASGIAPAASAGLFSVTQCKGQFLAVGGDYKAEAVPAPAFAFHAWPGAMHADGGNGRGAPSGYRSGSACSEGDGALLATGPSGTDWLPFRSHAPRGRAGAPLPVDPARWSRLSDAGYDSVASAGRVFWFSGDGGRLGRLELPAR
jgi:photosystem II stability/assembly factor-like uncharacterized protein